MANHTSRYLDDLPAIFADDEDAFLGRFLQAFEQVFTGVDHEAFEEVFPGLPKRANPGLEEILDGIAGAGGMAGVERYFAPGQLAEGQLPEDADPQRTPAAFLEWLAGWVALALREDWSEEEQRRIIANIVPSYHKRGTRDGLRQVLASYTGLPLETIEILELDVSLQVGVTSTVGEDTILGGGPPHYFLVRMLIPVTGSGDLARRERIARAIIDLEKPAHTYYDLQLDVRTLQIAVRSTVGVDTVLGTVS